MNSLEIRPTHVQLKGLSRTAEFTIKNKNEMLAAAYQLRVLGDDEEQWSVFPERGFLMKGQQQRVRVKLGGSNHTECSLGEINTTLQLLHTFKTDYNRHYMKAQQIRGWSQLATHQPPIKIEVTTSHDKEAIEQYIKEEVVFAKTFAPSELQISAIEPKEKTVIEEASFAELGLQSKSEVKPWLDEGSSEDVVVQTPLASEDINTLKFGQSRSGSFGVSPIKRFEETQRQYIYKHPVNMSQPLPPNSLHTVNQQSFPNFSSLPTDSNRNRSLQLIILAVIAAFFCALGSNMARLFG